MSNYELLKQKIQEAIPTLMDWSIGNIIKQIKGENSGEIYTIGYDCWLKSNGKYIELADSLDYNLSDFILIGKEPMLNDVLEWLKILSQEMYGETDLRLYNHFVIHFLGTWDLSSPYLKDQNISMLDRLIILYDGGY
jgi:hypothetical protein